MTRSEHRNNCFEIVYMHIHTQRDTQTAAAAAAPPNSVHSWVQCNIGGAVGAHGSYFPELICT